MDLDEMTTQEWRWWERFCRVLDKKPDSLVLQVHPTAIIATRRDWMDEHFAKHGNVDNVSELESVVTRGIVPCSESM